MSPSAIVGSGLRGLTALVTGGSRGIGRGIASAFASHGANVVLTSRDAQAAINAANALGDTVTGVECDVTNSDSIAACVAKTKELGNGSIHVLVNCAGVNFDSVLLRATDASIDQVLATNLAGPIKVTRAVLKAGMRQKDSLSIINVGSVVGSIGNRGQCVYSASKAGLVGFTKSLAKEYGGRGVRANVLEPGFIDVGMTEDLSEGKDKALSMIPQGRFGTVTEVAQMAVFLADPTQSSYVNGQILRVDGGVA